MADTDTTYQHNWESGEEEESWDQYKCTKCGEEHIGEIKDYLGFEFGCPVPDTVTVNFSSLDLHWVPGAWIKNANGIRGFSRHAAFVVRDVDTAFAIYGELADCGKCLDRCSVHQSDLEGWYFLTQSPVKEKNKRGVIDGG